MSYFRYIMQKPSTLKILLMLGKMEKKEKRGSASWTDSVVAVINALLEDLKDQVRNRLQWKNL